MQRSIIRWDAQGNALSTFRYMVALDRERRVIGLVDFEAHELAGGRMRDIVQNKKAVGSGTWPEWLAQSDIINFRVELDPNPGKARARIKALVHRDSGHRRERAAIEAEIEARKAEKRAEAKVKSDQMRAELVKRGIDKRIVDATRDITPEPAYIGDLVGGPGRPLRLDDQGRTLPRVEAKRPDLPIIRGERELEK